MELDALRKDLIDFELIGTWIAAQVLLESSPPFNRTKERVKAFCKIHLKASWLGEKMASESASAFLTILDFIASLAKKLWPIG
jgi:hypothetical protein